MTTVTRMTALRRPKRRHLQGSHREPEGPHRRLLAILRFGLGMGGPCHGGGMAPGQKMNPVSIVVPI